MAAIDVMRRYLEAVQRGDWATGFGFFADDIVLHVPGRSSLAGEHRGRPAAESYLRGDRIAEVWIFEANQYEVDELFADPPPGG
jgi:ketosteroid isomerase-like protein